MIKYSYLQLLYKLRERMNNAYLGIRNQDLRILTQTQYWNQLPTVYSTPGILIN
jgi:hypothetical protein